MTLVAWKEWLEVVKLAAEVIAIGAGGVWALFTFGALSQIARARAEIAKTDAERRKTEAELQALAEKALTGAVIEIDLIVTSPAVPNMAGTFLSVLAEVSNKGNRNAHIEYPEKPFAVYAVDRDAGGVLTPRLVAGSPVVSSINPAKRSLKLLVRAGGKERLPFFVALPGPGLYLVVVTLPLSKAEQEVAARYGFVSLGRWSAKRYVVVP